MSVEQPLVKVLQVVLSGGNIESWQDNSWGLGPRDIAMNVALPEVDGRILSRAVSFKGLNERDENTQCDIVGYQPKADRIAFVAKLAAGWAHLKTTSSAHKKVAIVLANYPNRDGRKFGCLKKGASTPLAFFFQILKLEVKESICRSISYCSIFLRLGGQQNHRPITQAKHAIYNPKKKLVGKSQ